jgi:hypothetical protein
MQRLAEMISPSLGRVTKCFVNILNNQTVALADGDLVVWNVSTPDGVRTTQAAAATLSLLVGAADGAIAASGYGLAQAYGYKSAVAHIDDTATPTTAGDIFVPVASKDYCKYSAGSDGKTGFLFAGEAVVTDSTPAETTKKFFIRAL